VAHNVYRKPGPILALKGIHTLEALMQRGLSVLVCAALILLGTVANNIAGPRKAAGNMDAIDNPIQYPFPKYVDITGVFLPH
jgi:hypothetical protein